MKRLWFWLTTSKICPWCKVTTHYAWIPLSDRLTNARRLPRVTHGICRECARRVLEA